MRILWLCNIVPPVVAEQLKIDTSVKEGWISGTLNRLISNNSPECELGICMPVSNIDAPYVKDNIRIEGFNIVCYRFLEQTAAPWVYDATLDKTAERIISDFKPDLVHSFGTEYAHSCAWAKAWNTPQRMLVSMQGVMKACAEEYTCHLSDGIVSGRTFRDLLKKDNITEQQNKFKLRSEFEKNTLLHAGHVAGRTEFDKRESLSINPDIKYHHLGETLRSEFYEGQWEPGKLDEHVIFVSQADYPLKGFHIILEAMPEVLRSYPDTVIKVGGNSITGFTTLKEKIKIGSYGQYLRKLMKDLKLEQKVIVLGKMSAAEMKENYLNSSVYVCASSVENSPNSMGEAMLLGMPVIASRTGGIPSIAEEGKEALMFEPCNSKQLASRIISLFGDRKLAEALSEAAVLRARDNYDADKNYADLMEIYREICQ